MDNEVINLTSVNNNKADDNEVFCRSCGKPIRRNAEICPNCGVRQFTLKPRKDRTLAVILALFLGGLGAHKFYMRKTGMGIIYLLLCWTLIPAFISLFEALIYILDSDERFQLRVG